MTRARGEQHPSARQPVFGRWWSAERVQLALAQGLIETGELRINAKQPEEAFVRSKRYRRDIFIKKSLYRNRALDGDLVAVLVQARPLPQTTSVNGSGSPETANVETEAITTTTSSLAGDHNETSPPTAFSSSGEEAKAGQVSALDIATDSSFETLHLCGRVVAVTERRLPRYLFGRIENIESVLYVFPDDQRLPPFRIELKGFTPRAQQQIWRHVGHLAAAMFTGSWDPWESYPRCNILRLWVVENDLDAEMSLIRLKFAVPSITNCMASDLEALGISDRSGETPEMESNLSIGQRRDFRYSSRVFSIDPANARDVDDALSVCWDSAEQCYRVGIHIADVSHFVRPGSAVDEEATRRGNTFYFVDHAVPMLPAALSEDLCSLLPNRDRKTLSLEFLLAPDGVIRDDPWIGRALVRNAAKLSYVDAQRILSDLETEPPAGTLEADIRVLHHLAARLRQRRLERGALCLGQRQLRLNWTADERGRRCAAIEKRDEAHSLVEEFMLLANEQIARLLIRYFPKTALLRRHLPLDEDQLHRIARWAAKRQIPLDVHDTRAIQKSLDALAVSTPAAFYTLRNKLAKAMVPAAYVCAGDMENLDACRHTALAVGAYTHFTSPIRRYADIVVHRQVLLALDAISNETHQCQIQTAQQVSAIAEHCNQRKRDAEAAQAAATWLHLTLAFYHEPQEYTAIITGFPNRSRYVQVYVPSLDFETLLDITLDLGAVVRRCTACPKSGLEELELAWPSETWQRILQSDAQLALAVKSPEHAELEEEEDALGETFAACARVRELDAYNVALHGQLRPQLRPRVRMILEAHPRAEPMSHIFQAAQEPFLVSESEAYSID
jgi:VacB/RNase II family 3'-5' exoribonuclease